MLPRPSPAPEVPQSSELKVKIEVLRLPQLFYSPAELSAILSIPAEAIKRLARSGELQGVILPGARSVRIAARSVVDFANRILGGAPQCSYPETGRLGRIFCSLLEVAAILSISDNSVRYLLKKGELAAVRLSQNRLHIPYQAVLDFAARQASTPAVPKA